MLRMSLINVAVKSGPPSPCPFCCSVLVPLRCSQSLEQIVTLMMDMQPPPSILLTQPHGWSRVTALPACVLPPSSFPRECVGGSQTAVFTPSARRKQKTTLHTDFISTDKFGGDAAQFIRLQKQKRGEPHGGVRESDAALDCCCAKVFTVMYFWAQTLQTAMFISQLRDYLLPV